MFGTFKQAIDILIAIQNKHVEATKRAHRAGLKHACEVRYGGVLALTEAINVLREAMEEEEREFDRRHHQEIMRATFGNKLN